jgi:hypothetical protein
VRAGLWSMPRRLAQGRAVDGHVREGHAMSKRTRCRAGHHNPAMEKRRRTERRPLREAARERRRDAQGKWYQYSMRELRKASSRRPLMASKVVDGKLVWSRDVRKGEEVIIHCPPHPATLGTCEPIDTTIEFKNR